MPLVVAGAHLRDEAPVAAADEAAGRPDLTPHGGWRAWRAAGSPR